MNCPACESPMEELKIDGVELDQCRRCRGVWFDSMEIDSILALPRIPECLMRQQLYQEPPRLRLEGERPCPRCGRGLRTIEVDAIRLDACTGCKGFFADLGEIRLLVEASERRYAAAESENTDE